MGINRKQDVIFILLFQTTLLILFAIFAEYGKKFGLEKYPMFQDVHVMIFVGFGFLMTFLRQYGYSSVGFNFLLGTSILQWALICQGFYNLNENCHIEITIENLLEADIATAAVLISMGAVLGRTSYIQLLVMGIVEIAVFSANSYLSYEIFKISDVGGSIVVHTFGAYFGLAASYVVSRKEKKPAGNLLEQSNYTSDLFAMIGTIFLWLYWPSFNAIELKGNQQQRAIINTYLSLTSCCVTTFAMSVIFSPSRKFDMVLIQNSTLAGGVVVGTAVNLMLQPFGAVMTGMLAGGISVFGYVKVSPWLKTNFDLQDTCGVHNLHGMPGVLAGFIGAFLAAIASETTYNEELYEIFPIMAVSNATVEFNFNRRSTAKQAGFQFLALFVTVLIAGFSGLITGLIMKNRVFSPLENKFYYSDEPYWSLPLATKHETDIKKGPILLFTPFIKNTYLRDA